MKRAATETTRLRKNITFNPITFNKAKDIIGHDKRPRPFSVLLEDLVEQEWSRMFGKSTNGRRAV